MSKIGFRIPIILGVLFVIVVAGAIVYSHYAWQKGLSQFQASIVSKAPIDEVQTSNLQLEKISECPDCYLLAGEIQNNSDYSFNWITGTVDAYDCPTSTITSDCAHIGQNADTILEVEENGVATTTGNTVLVDVPPHQVRAVSGPVGLDGMPAVQGHFLWTFKITQLQEWPPFNS